MDSLVTSKLSQFFDTLLDEDGSSQQIDPRITKSKRKKKKLKKDTRPTEETRVNEVNGTERKNEKPSKSKRKKDQPVDETIGTEKKEEKPGRTKRKRGKEESPSEPVSSQSFDLTTRTFSSSTQKLEPKPEKFTDDGFKIVTSIPDDDSDVSDAFEYYSEDEDDPTLHQEAEGLSKPNTKVHKVHTVPSKMTEDGFKIVTEIPSDDSDVSDAFEDEGLGIEPELESEDPRKNIKKPILQIMNDFGICEDIFHNKQKEPEANKPTVKKRKRKGTTNTVTLAGKKKGETQVIVLDYTQRRGTGNKKKKPEEVQAVDSTSLEKIPTKTLDEKQLKRVRYDVFKLGMSGFDKQKKEDTRVALAIKLGAKPPKNKHINYNEFMAKRKEEKKKETEERELQRKLGMKVFKPRKSDQRPVVKATTAQIGHYKHGVQVLSRKDIAKIQGGKR